MSRSRPETWPVSYWLFAVILGCLLVVALPMVAPILHAP